MARYIGLDVHSASCTMLVLSPSGKKLACHVVQTNAKSLIDLIKTIPRPRLLCIEEGTQSAWLYETLSAHVDQMTVEAVSRTRGPAKPKDDLTDALGLAERLRTNSIKSKVFKDVGRFGKLRELVRVYGYQVRDTVRVQNRLKAVYRSRGIKTGDAIYHPDDCKEWVSQLAPKLRPVAQLLSAQYQAVEQVREQAEKQLEAEARKHPIVAKLRTIPGIGSIRSAQLAAFIVSAHRFRTKRQLWNYSGLGVVSFTSSNWDKDNDGPWERRMTNQTRGLNRNHNTIFKDIFKGAATTVIQRSDPTCPLYQHYLALTQGKTKPNLAKLTIARQIAAITLTIMKKEVVYDPAAISKTTT